MSTLPTQPSADPEPLDLTFELAGVGLCLSRQRVVERCNPAFGAMFGYAAGDLRGCSMRQLYPSDEEFERTGARWLPAMLDSGAYSDERLMRRRDGSLFWCHVIGRAADPARPFDCAVWTFDDISLKRPVKLALTGREREVAPLLINGKSSKEIGKILAISPRTVDAHRARLMHKLAVRSRIELISKLLGFSSVFS